VNRLGGERSPYLIQHAHNPVDWFPWGDAAFEKARADDKPIFLSIGYSTCHWCHVMAHESFENEAIAAVLNDKYVSIKVDREERPDVDRVYMTFVQATTGSGGWPMSVWLTPEGRPFFGGTYFPPTSRWGRPGFAELLQEIARAWTAERGKVEQSAGSIAARLKTLESAAPEGDRPGPEALDRTVAGLESAFDARYGGFGEAPKFPRPSELFLLLREFRRTGNARARDMALATLRAMALGGMRDHVGGGFHRYSVDAAWRVPHFEKMLYDQAQLVLAYIEAAQASGDRFFADVAEDTLQYVMRELTDADGGFFSAEDADSVPPEHAGEEAPHKTEGAFYLWRADEIDELAGGDAAIVRRRFGIEANGNAPSDPQQEFTGKNLLYVASSVDDIAAAVGRTAHVVESALARARLRMFEARLRRPRPHLDDKVLTAWNGLMIAAFARTARVLGALRGADPAPASYLAAARRAATFARERLWRTEERRLWRRYRTGEAGIDAYAEDYAFLAFGLLELFQATGEAGWLDWAIELQEQQDALFWDEAGAGWFSTTGQDPTVLLRMKEDYDGAEPTASSVAVMNLLVLTHLVDRPEWNGRIERTFRAFSVRLEQLGRGVPMMGAALSTAIAGLQQILIVGDDRRQLERTVARHYLPFAISLSVTPENRQSLVDRLPWLASMTALPDGSARAYVCRDFTCRAPVDSAEALEVELA
jgi:uncharacterized protein YyaL (SSP411 family)